MMPIKYKYGIRVERYSRALFLGIGVTWFTEQALQVDLLFFAVTIGRVFSIED